MGESSFEEVAKEIVFSSIVSAVCIDDQFPEPYGSVDDEVTQPYWDKTKDLYEDFRRNNCNLDVYQFDRSKWSSNREFVLKSRDLLILDWVLTDPSDISIPLDIIEKSINDQMIPYIIIYSDEPHDNIIRLLFSFFSYSFGSEEDTNSNFKILKGNLQNKLDKIEGRKIDDIDIFLENIAQDNLHFFSCIRDTKEISREIFSQIRQKIPDETAAGQFYGDLKKEFENNFGTSGINFLNILIPRYVTQLYNFSDKSYSIKRIPNEESSFYINNILVTILDKTFNANEVYEKIASIAYKDPRNFLTLLAMEIKNYYAKYSREIGNNLFSIDDRTFFHHRKSTENEEEFSEFVMQCFREDFSSFGRKNTPKIFKTLDDYQNNYLNNAPLHNIERELVRLNYYYSVVDLSNRMNSKISFGDIFKAYFPEEDCYKYLLCITPHCDCAFPDNKISNRFYFVEGSELNIRTGLEGAEKKCYSFILDDEEPVCIEWRTKPFTIFIPETLNNISQDGITICIDTEKISISYIGTLKENFTQRIANNSFSNSLRVGITMAKLTETNGDESTIQ